MALKSLGVATATDTDVATKAYVDDVTLAVFSYVGNLATYNGTARFYNDTGRTITFNSVTASVGTAPTGAAVIVNVLKNGTSIWNVTTANRPTIAISGFTAAGGARDTTTWASGEYITVKIDQIGSTITGADLTVQVRAS